MAGTKAGSNKAVQTIYRLYGKDFFSKVGAMGGRKSTGGGFGQGEIGRQRASYWGRVGGKTRRRRDR